MPKPPALDRSVTRIERLTALVALIAGGLFTALLLGMHLAEPEFDPTWRFASEYALGRVGIVMTLAFVALALALLGTAVAVVRHVRTVPGYLGLGIIAIAAAGLLLAAAFPTDPITTPTDRYSFSGQMHVLGASLDYSPVGMLLAGWALTRTTSWRPLRRPLMVAAGAAFGLLFTFTAALPQDGQFGPGVYAGLMGRLLLLSYLAWTTIACRGLLRRSVGPGPDEVRAESRRALSR